MIDSKTIFNISKEGDFEKLSLHIFSFQYHNNSIYHDFCKLLNVNHKNVKTSNQIPFLPISFFKTQAIKTGSFKEEAVFLSSGTTGQERSKHFIKELELYKKSYRNNFQQFYGSIADYCLVALLPSYMEREGSSLIYMIDDLIQQSKHPKSGFFLNQDNELIDTLTYLSKMQQKTILFGVSFALLDLAEKYKLDLSNCIIMETGGMKGRREEITRMELHAIYKNSFNVNCIHSEYGMTELLSQSYSKGNGIFCTPPWMKITIRDVNDPFHYLSNNQTGGINVIDLANIYSCSFIATQDLGKLNTNNGFEVLGRFDNSDLRGCNLLINN